MPTPAPSAKQVVRKYLAAITHGKPGDLAKWAAADIKAVQGTQQAQGLAALEHYSATYRSQFPGWKIEIERMIGEGNWVSASGRSTAQSAGQPISVPFVAQYRVARGKVAEVIIAVDASVTLGGKPASAALRLEPDF